MRRKYLSRTNKVGNSEVLQKLHEDENMGKVIRNRREKELLEYHVGDTELVSDML